MARRPPSFDPDALITQYQHDASHPRADEALHMLRKIGSVVKPIMRQRSWRVGTLAEFYPSQDNLLGLNTNRGQIIHLRLRHAGDPSQFLPFESVVDTMLHELCHNVIGPHNQEFHALWDQLRDEHEALIRKGYTGEGFLGNGRMLGGRQMPRREANRLARQAAELRKSRNQGSGQRLGGTGILRGQDARSVIADAVERRLKIEQGCASGTEAGNKVARDEVQKGSMTTTLADPTNENDEIMMQAYIDLIQEDEREKFGGYYDPPTAANPAGPRGVQGKGQDLVAQQREIEREILKERQRKQEERNTSISTRRPPPRTQPSDSSSRKTSSDPVADVSENQNAVQPSSSRYGKISKPEAPADTWTCEICTLINPATLLSCDACGVERPASISAILDRSSRRTSSNGNESKRLKSTRELPNALKPRSSAYDSIARFNAEQDQKLASRPVGWLCGACGNFMESEWWTCAQCGTMKSSS